MVGLMIDHLKFPNWVVVMLVVYGKVPLVKLLVIEVMEFLMVERVMLTHSKV